MIASFTASSHQRNDQMVTSVSIAENCATLSAEAIIRVKRLLSNTVSDSDTKFARLHRINRKKCFSSGNPDIVHTNEPFDVTLDSTRWQTAIALSSNAYAGRVFTPHDAEDQDTASESQLHRLALSDGGRTRSARLARQALCDAHRNASTTVHLQSMSSAVSLLLLHSSTNRVRLFS